MATFFNLPVPAGNGSGASVDVSTLSGQRTVTISKTVFSGIILLEGSDDNINFASVARFDSGSQKQTVLLLACQFVRITRSGAVPEVPAVPTVQIGAITSTAGVFGTLAVAAGDGAGAAFDISAGGDLITIIGTGTFNRAVYIEGSQDAGVTWSRIDDLGKFESAKVVHTVASFNRLRTFSEQSAGGDAPIVMVGSMAFGGAGSSGLAKISRNYYADQLSIPNVNWPVPLIAPSDLDNVASSYTIVEYDDTVETGRGMPESVPIASIEGYNAVSLLLSVIGKPAAAPPAIRSIGLKGYFVTVKDNIPVGAWAAFTIGDFIVEANSNFQYQSFTIPLGAGAGQINAAPGDDLLIEITRVAPAAGTNLTGDFYVGRYKITWQ